MRVGFWMIDFSFCHVRKSSSGVFRNSAHAPYFSQSMSRTVLMRRRRTSTSSAATAIRHSTPSLSPPAVPRLWIQK